MSEPGTEVVKKNKRRRDPERTREAILEVAGKLLATDGPEGLSVSKVAQIVGVNRGTAYHHFQTRDQLLSATIAWVSEKLCSEAFGDLSVNAETASESGIRPRQVTENLANFAMEYPEYGRVWLVSMLNSENPENDPYWSRYKSLMDYFVDSDMAQPDIDGEVHAMLMVVGTILWPVWKRANKCSEADRRTLVKRFTNEVLRLNVNGVLKKEKFPGLDTAED